MNIDAIVFFPEKNVFPLSPMYIHLVLTLHLLLLYSHCISFAFNLHLSYNLIYIQFTIQFTIHLLVVASGTMCCRCGGPTDVDLDIDKHEKIIQRVVLIQHPPLIGHERCPVL